MTLKSAFCLLFILLFVKNYGQNKCKTRLFLSSKDITQPTADTVFINNIRHKVWGDSISVKTDKKIKKLYASESVWGYQDHEVLNGCLIFRNYNQEFYKVKQIGSLIIYSKITGAGKYGYYSTYYFSKTLDSPLYVLNWKNIKEQFKDNTCFIERIQKDIKWYQDYEKIDKENGNYKLIELYDKCK